MSQYRERPVIEAVLESGEVLIDTLMREDVLSEIPVVGTAFRICKAADSIRDKAFAAKLHQFVVGLSSVSEDQKEKIREKFSENSAEATKIGETLLLVIERLTDMDKPLLLGKVFLAYIDGALTSSDLRRLSQAIDLAFFDDLKVLLEIREIPPLSDQAWLQYLTPSGLTRMIGGQDVDNLGAIYFEVTPLGYLLRAANKHQQGGKG